MPKSPPELLREAADVAQRAYEMRRTSPIEALELLSEVRGTLLGVLFVIDGVLDVLPEGNASIRAKVDELLKKDPQT